MMIIQVFNACVLHVSLSLAFLHDLRRWRVQHHNVGAEEEEEAVEDVRWREGKSIF